MNQESGSHFKLHRSTSFDKKNSMVRISKTGSEHRPNIFKKESAEKMPQRVYDLMESYLPKDVHSIERQ